MSREQDNKAIVGRWFEGFWGNPRNPEIIDELAAPDIVLQYSLHAAGPDPSAFAVSYGRTEPR